jgi:preprotein translocase subunit YajC
MHSTPECDELTDALEAYVGAVCKLTMLPLKCYCKGLRTLVQTCGGSESNPLALKRAAIERGMTVVTRGGVFGTVIDADEQAVTVRIAENVEVRVRPSHLAAVRRPHAE